MMPNKGKLQDHSDARFINHELHYVVGKATIVEIHDEFGFVFDCSCGWKSRICVRWAHALMELRSHIRGSNATIPPEQQPHFQSIQFNTQTQRWYILCTCGKSFGGFPDRATTHIAWQEHFAQQRKASGQQPQAAE